MNEANRGLERRLFTLAIQQGPDERDVWAAGACQDPAVSTEVDALIASEPEVEGGEGARRFGPDDRLGRYVVEGLLAVGGMGELYRAHDTRLDRTVALKVLPSTTAALSDWRDRLEREARAVSQLNHPNVCAIYDIGQHDGVDFLVMEYLEGETLAERLQRGLLPLQDVFTYGLQIIDALGAAHARGIVHRDLTPANIMLTRTGVKLLDFGIAKSAEVEPVVASFGAATAPAMTQHGARVGTPGYMAPEQIRGDAVDARADIFAFGAVLYEMTTGVRAFDGIDRNTIFAAVLEGRVRPIREIRADAFPGLEQVVQRCLGVNPEARYQSATDIRRELEAIVGRRGRLRRAAGAATAAALLLSGLLAWQWYGGERPPDPGGKRLMLAVLPFVNQTADPAQDYLTQGVADELITELGRLRPDRLGVIARTSAMRFQNSRQSAERIRHDLGVDYFIEGTVARLGSRIRIGVRLVRASDQSQVWAERYERELGDILLVQAEVARSIADKIALALSPEQAARLEARSAIDAGAYERYLKGRYFWGKRSREGLTRAIGEFEAATRISPRFAAAHAGLSDAFLLMGYYSYMPPATAFSRARTAAMTALDLDDGLAEAHVSLAGILHNYDRRWSDAEREYLHALRLNENYATAHQWYANHLIALRRPGEAKARIQRAHELDPLSVIIQVNAGNIHLLSRDYDRAIEECTRALELEPNFVTGRWVLGRAHALKGEYDQAIDQFRRGLTIEPQHALLRAALARTYALAGRTSDAQSIASQLVTAHKEGNVSALELASVYGALGPPDDALAWLETAVVERAALLVFLAVDPDYDGLRSDRRFQDLVRRIGLD